jgi:nitrogen fixation NifU-like protein
VGRSEATGELISEEFLADLEEAMRDVVDPELGINVVDLGLLYGVNIDDSHNVTLDMTLTSAACPLTDVITDQVIGQDVGAALKTIAAFTEMISSRGTVEGDEDVIGDGIAFAGVSKYPARVKCALLGWMAFKDALAQASEEISDERHRSA